ncbi:hypothetical protein GCM10010517_74190 [Streptosporangium fragile]|uniref:Uncharacterized protein n=1 Tax=Streptosporangium fragile TaxID=46186 RepID=A0ABP6ISE2_9ACTN
MTVITANMTTTNTTAETAVMTTISAVLRPRRGDGTCEAMVSLVRPKMSRILLWINNGRAR